MSRKFVETTTKFVGSLIPQNEEPGRLFVDLDGTLAEWRRLGLMSEEDLFALLKSDGYYRTLKPYENVLKAVRELVRLDKDRVYILSSYIPDCPALLDKECWVDEHLPEIPDTHRIFVPYGEKKADWIPGTVRQRDVLLDDYNKNLRAWPGIGVKVVNPVNHQSGSWEGMRVGYKANPRAIMRLVENCMGK